MVLCFVLHPKFHRKLNDVPNKEMKFTKIVQKNRLWQSIINIPNLLNILKSKHRKIANMTRFLWRKKIKCFKFVCACQLNIQYQTGITSCMNRYFVCRWFFFLISKGNYENWAWLVTLNSNWYMYKHLRILICVLAPIVLIIYYYLYVLNK